MGEYELGYVYSFKAWGSRGVLKIGYLAQMENPYMKLYNKDDTDDDPKETLLTHGPQITLISAF